MLPEQAGMRTLSFDGHVLVKESDRTIEHRKNIVTLLSLQKHGIHFLVCMNRGTGKHLVLSK